MLEFLASLPCVGSRERAETPIHELAARGYVVAAAEAPAFDRDIDIRPGMSAEEAADTARALREFIPPLSRCAETAIARALHPLDCDWPTFDP